MGWVWDKAPYPKIYNYFPSSSQTWGKTRYALSFPFQTTIKISSLSRPNPSMCFQGGGRARLGWARLLCFIRK